MCSAGPWKDPSPTNIVARTAKIFPSAELPIIGNVPSGLQEAGLSYLHLLPVFDIATINENKAEWQEPDPAVLATYPPDSNQPQAAVVATENLDGFNWGYDPFHYTVPEGSYSTDPDGVTRILEFREMIQSLNEDIGLRAFSLAWASVRPTLATCGWQKVAPGISSRFTGWVFSPAACSTATTPSSIALWASAAPRTRSPIA